MPTLYSTSAPAKIPSIDTIYKGYRFRSRLEARWAVFFDHLKLNWVYEHEGYALPSGWYLPDFWFPDDNVFVEIKPGERPPVVIQLYDSPELAAFRALYPNTKSRGDLAAFVDTPEQRLVRELTEGIGCGGAVFYGDPINVFSYSYVGVNAWVDEGGHMLWDRMRRNCRDAALAARQARFEHGERP
ncbi:MAG: hypothetical protein EOQ31_31535 [Mesorhizobium sp.]|uniref:hypothetical protein n=1 Tax=Mesorhizobium sp. TaxID=1871066 RepID=UPI000FE49665|nr:hypothetical protein [Mesorhizobium sp.]RWA81479.1 MAG: hypothetical protein EOQ31_31535 [Mesorhizobium sp.]